MVNLRKVYDCASSQRARDAANLVRKFVADHSDAEVVKLSPALNEKLWSRSISRPPRHLKIKIIERADVATAELVEDK